MQKEIKLLHVIASIDPKSGGTSSAITNAYKALKSIGIDFEVVCLDAPGEVFLKNSSFPIHALGPSITGWQYSKQLIPWLRDNITRFDIVILNGVWLYTNYAVRKVTGEINKKTKGQKSPPVFLMPHGMLDPYFQKAENRKMKALRNSIYWKLIEQKNIEKSEGVLFTCEEELLLARNTFSPYKPKAQLNVGMGITAPPAFRANMSDAFFEKCPAVKNSHYLLFLSRVNDKKGIDLLIDGYIKVYGCRPADAYIQKNSAAPALVIAGPGLNTPFAKEMMDRAAASPLSENIHFTGMLEGNAKWGAFYNCQAFVLPSHQENFGIAIVEAMACSKPIIISNRVNIWREIQKAEAGLVEEDTLEGTIRSLKKWADLSVANQIEMGINAQQCYKQQFAIEPAAERLLNTLLPYISR